MKPNTPESVCARCGGDKELTNGAGYIFRCPNCHGTGKAQPEAEHSPTCTPNDREDGHVECAKLSDITEAEQPPEPDSRPWCTHCYGTGTPCMSVHLDTVKCWSCRNTLELDGKLCSRHYKAAPQTPELEWGVHIDKGPGATHFKGDNCASQTRAPRMAKSAENRDETALQSAKHAGAERAPQTSAPDELEAALVQLYMAGSVDDSMTEPLEHVRQLISRQVTAREAQLRERLLEAVGKDEPNNYHGASYRNSEKARFRAAITAVFGEKEAR